MAEWDWLCITDGTEQNSRFSYALREGYFNADEMALEDLLAMSVEFASALHFHKINNEKDGSWAELFTADEAVIMAQILSKDLKRMDSEFLRLLELSMISTAKYVNVLAKDIDFWFKSLYATNNSSANTLSWKIAEIIKQRLAAELHSVGELRWRLMRGEKGTVINDFEGFDKIWGIKKKENTILFPQSKLPKLGSIVDEKHFLRSAFYAFINSFSYLQTITQEYFEDSFHSQAHNPAMGLFIAFLKLFQKAQYKINTFTPRHHDFYYYQFLKVAPRNHIPDSAYLVLKAAPDSDGVLVSKGTEFIAGKDQDKKERVYLADNDLVVTGAQVQSLYTLYFERDKLISPEKEFNYITRAQTSRLLIDGTIDAESKLQPLHIFGAVQPEVGKKTSKEANIGFAVASGVLLLKEGSRKIEITITFTDPASLGSELGDIPVDGLINAVSEVEFFTQFGKLLSRYLLTHHGMFTEENKTHILKKAEKLLNSVSLEVIRNLLKLDRQDLFYKVLKNIFTISLTAENGWHEVPNYIIEPFTNGGKAIQKGLKCILTLGPEIDPIIPYDTKIHAGRWQTGLPLIRFSINGTANFYPYSLFHGLILEEVSFEVNVEGTNDLLAYNNHGQLDPAKPFQPFGPLPTCNSYFLIGNYELAKKNLTALNVDIEWGELPRSNGGFREFYQGYETSFSNDVFESEVSVIQDGQWLPTRRDGKQKIPLFATKKNGGAVHQRRFLKIDILHYFKPINSRLSEEDFRFDIKTRNGFFKLALTGPASAFGHKEYPALLTRILSENVKSKKPKQIPNIPYTPLINRMTLNYSARSVINLRQDISIEPEFFGEKLYHFQPFGLHIIYPAIRGVSHCLLPQYRYDGNLFVGISARQLSGKLTLFFHILEDCTQQTSIERTEIFWFYLSSNRWVRFESSSVVSDTTGGLLSSGIVTLDMPEDIDKKNTIMPDGLFWLRISANKNLHSICSLYSICAQALKVSRRKGGNALDRFNKQLPAGSISQTSTSITGLDKICQVEESFGGRPAESPTQLKTRTSERLRHKNRASVPWDYERLILEHFPEIFKVKCFSNTASAKDKVQPGHVLIVVVPYLKESEQDKSFKPMVNAIELTRIRDCVKKLVSPFAEIEVRNPVYERIQVRCTVKLAGDAHDGYCLTKLNKTIVDFVSPWHSIGYKAKFGWSIRRQDLESHIRELDYVDFITNFSMIHITKDDESVFSLADTARSKDGRPESASPGTAAMDGVAHSDEIHPRYPWSLAIPMRNHFIETMGAIRTIDAEPTGIDELEVGSTFIINENHSHG
ncbi:MAG: baseplate J/gp47 family protein [Pseudomonadota bacterium]